MTYFCYEYNTKLTSTVILLNDVPEMLGIILTVIFKDNAQIDRYLKLTEDLVTEGILLKSARDFQNNVLTTRRYALTEAHAMEMKARYDEIYVGRELHLISIKSLDMFEFTESIYPVSDVEFENVILMFDHQ